MIVRIYHQYKMKNYLIVFFLIICSSICVAEPSKKDVQNYATLAQNILPNKLRDSMLYMIEASVVQSGYCVGYYSFIYRFVKFPETSGYVEFSPKGLKCIYEEKVVLDGDVGGMGFRRINLDSVLISFAQAKNILAQKNPNYKPSGNFTIAHPLQPDITSPIYFIYSINQSNPTAMVDSSCGAVFFN